ncbi:hypothetical protein PMY56_11470 [Clostridium tertium]|jgi:uncharacterized protein|uniref:5' nucleotidase, NT5C type n=1 Tax=Clostridium TaxID=1485 RepID=UPI00115AF0F6|nr:MULTISPECIES: hypothetical protein [Clostridium]MBS5308373.1 hypothetical protein [Clostridium sp.]MBS6500602.1 hypothetical protein [Clostridium sp.]MDB1923097.1 hypothetical protein [Clostridium tertium]MDB1926761.1 hypothetical protein [Clostridium tertium]MDB1930166.1 hypothetical protein [Clostridium tertium]
MKKFNICIDIDGTITDAYYWLEPCNRYFKTNIKENEVTEYSIPKILGISEERYLEFYEKYKYELHSKQKIREHVRYVINELSLYSNIYFVTAREKNLALLTHGYLRKNSIYYDNLYLLGSHYKVDKARELNCNIFIEDNYSNAIDLSNAGFKVLLINTNYNKDPINKNILRVNNWLEIYTIVKKLLLQSEAM